MKPTYAICRTEKVKTWGSLSKSVGHNLRTSNEDRSHLRPGMKEPMRVLVGDASWVDSWKEQVEGMHLRKLQQGQTHTLAREFFLGMSPEWAEGKSKREIDAWAQANIDWLQHRFGVERVKFAVLHLDEQTPHIAAYVVPLKVDTKAGRGNGWTLSDRELNLGGNKSALVELQDEYATAMATFALARGVRGSKATHRKTSEWRREQKRAEQLTPVKVPQPPVATVGDRVNIEAYGARVAKETAASVIEQMKPYHAAALKASKERTQLAKEVKTLRDQVVKLGDLAEAFKAFLAALLGRAPNLDTIEGLHEATAAAASIVQQHRGTPQANPVQPPALPAVPPRAPRATPPRGAKPKA
jgi:hypothetical protein